VTRADVRAGGEGMGPVAGDHVTALYGFDRGALGHFNSHRARTGGRFGLQVYGSKGVIQVATGSLPAAYFLADPTWFPGRSKVAWQEVSSAGLGKAEPLKDGGPGMGNVWIARDLIAAIEQDRQPLGGVYDGRAALEMILAVYESHRLKGAVPLPLQNRRHPLTLL
jgi:predicted dehydrogenase